MLESSRLVTRTWPTRSDRLSGVFQVCSVYHEQSSPSNPMPTRHPNLGSLAFQAPSTQTIHVSSSTCHNLSVFKGVCSTAASSCSFLRSFLAKPWETHDSIPIDILKEYRRLDDTILMRLNRANAAVRDHERIHRETGGGTIQDQACASLWRELVGTSWLLTLDSWPMAGIWLLILGTRKLATTHWTVGILYDGCWPSADWKTKYFGRSSTRSHQQKKDSRGCVWGGSKGIIQWYNTTSTTMDIYNII